MIPEITPPPNKPCRKRIASNLNGFANIAWVSAAYLFASTAATRLWGKLGDMLGRRRLYLVAIAVFLVASSGS